jgi:hypothetical protein
MEAEARIQDPKDIPLTSAEACGVPRNNDDVTPAEASVLPAVSSAKPSSQQRNLTLTKNGHGRSQICCRAHRGMGNES